MDIKSVKTEGLQLERVYLHNQLFVPGFTTSSHSLQRVGNNQKEGFDMWLYKDYVWLFLTNDKNQACTVVMPTAQIQHMVLVK